MIELLHDLSDWLVGFAASDWAILVLAAASFAESIFFPVPPDLLLIGISIIQPDQAIWLGALTTVSSVAGAVVGHWLGRRLGRPVLYRLFPETKVAMAERMFGRHGVWATLLAAFTPLPYKLFAISAGAFDLDRRTFILASLVGRGARFISLGALIFIFGESIEAFIGDNFEVLTVGLAAGAVAAVVAWGIVGRLRRARGAAR